MLIIVKPVLTLSVKTLIIYRILYYIATMNQSAHESGYENEDMDQEENENEVEVEDEEEEAEPVHQSESEKPLNSTSNL